MDIYATSLLRAMLVLAALQGVFHLSAGFVRWQDSSAPALPASLPSAFYAVAVVVVLSARGEIFYAALGWACVGALGLRGLAGLLWPGGWLCALLSGLALLPLAAMILLLMRTLF